MRWVAVSVLARTMPSADGGGGQRIEIPLSGGRAFRLLDPDYREMVSEETQPMTFERALLFARGGRRIVRKSWDMVTLGTIHVVEGRMCWSLDDGMTVMLAGEDLLATDWIVLP